MKMSSEDFSCTPPEIRASAANVVTSLLPEKSKSQYEKQFQQFLEWCNTKSVEKISENVLLAYFDEQSKKYKTSALWSTYSKLRSCLAIFRNVDISKYVKLQAFLKRMSVGYVPKKSKILEESEINKFIKEADNKLYLAMKIILIMDYSGAYRREELTNMSIDDVECTPHLVAVSVPKTKNNVPRQFMITNPDWIDLIAKYAALRPKMVTHKIILLYQIVILFVVILCQTKIYLVLR